MGGDKLKEDELPEPRGENATLTQPSPPLDTHGPVNNANVSPQSLVGCTVSLQQLEVLRLREEDRETER